LCLIVFTSLQNMCFIVAFSGTCLFSFIAECTPDVIPLASLSFYAIHANSW
jgi:hypothetical protein